MKRVVIPELLDSDAGTPEEIAASLRDLRWINGWFGGVRTLRLLLREAMRQAGLRRATLLSVAAGDASTAALAAASLHREGLEIEVTALDRSAAHLADSSCASRVAANALALPFRERSFDFVECTLFAHHLAPFEVTMFTIEALRVARHALLINDLRRSRLHLTFARLGCSLYSSRLTRHDAIASVRAAYTTGELCDLLSQAMRGPLSVMTAWFFRMGAIAWNRNGGA